MPEPLKISNVCTTCKTKSGYTRSGRCASHLPQYFEDTCADCANWALETLASGLRRCKKCGREEVQA